MEIKFESYLDKYLRQQESIKKRRKTISNKYDKFNLGDIVIYDHPLDGSNYPEKYEIVATKLDKKFHQYVMAKNVKTGEYKNTIFKDDSFYINEKYKWIDSNYFKTELEFMSNKYNL